MFSKTKQYFIFFSFHQKQRGPKIKCCFGARSRFAIESRSLVFFSFFYFLSLSNYNEVGAQLSIIQEEKKTINVIYNTRCGLNKIFIFLLHRYQNTFGILRTLISTCVFLKKKRALFMLFIVFQMVAALTVFCSNVLHVLLSQPF